MATVTPSISPLEAYDRLVANDGNDIEIGDERYGLVGADGDRAFPSLGGDHGLWVPMNVVTGEKITAGTKWVLIPD